MMEEYRKDVMKALEAMLGEGYEITPQDRRDNNCPVLHGICIRKKGEAQPQHQKERVQVQPVRGKRRHALPVWEDIRAGYRYCSIWDS